LPDGANAGTALLVAVVEEIIDMGPNFYMLQFVPAADIGNHPGRDVHLCIDRLPLKIRSLIGRVLTAIEAEISIEEHVLENAI
jgi:hypothetical protein